MQVFKKGFDLMEALCVTHNRGHFFAWDAVAPEALRAMEHEVRGLTLKVGDYREKPINESPHNTVQQKHARAYAMLGDPSMPIATQLCYDLAELVREHVAEFPELTSWLLKEMGYQRYSGDDDFIGPHRDRRSDHLLSVTFTITGSAWVHIYESLVSPPDYSRLRGVGAYLTEPGTVMFLRAPRFGSGEQTIHQVMPPISNEPRTILNLRDRTQLLPAPR